MPTMPMWRTVAFALIVSAPLVAAAVSSSQPPQEPTPFVSSSSELVVLPVVVTDKQGRYVSDLRREQFTVHDNGRPQDVELFSNEDTPVTIGLVIDDSGSMGPKLPEVVVAALAFARASNPEDELFTIEFNDRVRNATPGGTLFARDVDRLEATLASLVPQGRTALYNALLAGLDHVAKGTRPRKVLILVSDGGDNASQATLDEVLARATNSNVTIYTIGLFGEADPDRNPGVLKKLARATGGERFLPESAGPLLQVCQRIAREIRSGYTIGYVPPDRDGTYHRVRVQVASGDRRQLTVRTRPGYFAANPTRTVQQ